jgi:ABC-2 type transport system ATP-binding protein
MITVENLTKKYGKIIALNNVSFKFENQRVIAIMGENGAGKSTLLKIITGIIPFDQGRVKIDDIQINRKPVESRERIGYLPEMPEMYNRLTGREFLHYIASLRKMKDAEKRINKLSRMIEITDFLDYEIGSYSKGMKQKISIITAIMHDPNNLLLDEPVYGLDPLTSRAIQDFIKNKKGTTIIATHSTELVEKVADVVYFLMKGQVTCFDKVANLIDKYGSIEKSYFANKG